MARWLPLAIVALAVVLAMLLTGAIKALSLALGAVVLLAISTTREYLIRRRGWSAPMAAIPIYLVMAVVFVVAIQQFGLLPVWIGIGVVVGIVAQLVGLVLQAREVAGKVAK